MYLTYSPTCQSLLQASRFEEVVQSHAMQHLGPEPVEHREPDFSAVLGWIDVDSKRTLAERSIDDGDQCVGDRGYVGVSRHDRVERFLHLGAELRIRSGLVLAGHRLVGRRAGPGEV